ncbi:hypothetical protein ACROYT_G018416 [Oculina patagonica]
MILPDPIYQDTERDTKERRKVVRELVDKLTNPSFDDMIKIFAATFNLDEKTRDLNIRNKYKREFVLCQPVKESARGVKPRKQTTSSVRRENIALVLTMQLM